MCITVWRAEGLFLGRFTLSAGLRERTFRKGVIHVSNNNSGLTTVEEIFLLLFFTFYRDLGPLDLTLVKKKAQKSREIN